MAINDFNPLDLSAYTPKKPTEDESKKTNIPPPPKAVVRRVGIGPLLHSRFTKFFVFVAILFFLAFASYAATQWWLLNR